MLYLYAYVNTYLMITLYRSKHIEGISDKRSFITDCATCWIKTLYLLTTTIFAPPSNASKWQMGFNSAFKGLNTILTLILLTWKIWWANNNASKSQMWFNLAFKVLSSSRSLHTMKAFGWSEGTDPLILNVHNKWMHAINFTPTERHGCGRFENRKFIVTVRNRMATPCVS